MNVTREAMYSGDTFEVRGYTFRLDVDHDGDMREPWIEHDGHGVVSAWTTRDKRPGERVLVEDGRSRRYYDIAATTKIALRDGWGVKRPGTAGDGPDDYKPLDGESKRAYAARAVEADFEHLRGWCNDEWHWLYIRVSILDEEGNVRDFDGIGGVEDPDGTYTPTLARELAAEILSRVEVDEPQAQLSEN